MKVLQKIKKIITPIRWMDCLFFVAFILLAMFKFLYFQYASTSSTGKLYSSNNTLMILCTLGTLLLLFTFTLLFSGKWRLILFFTLNIFLSIMIFANLNYYRYYKNPITIPVLFQLRLLGSVGESVTSMLKLSDLLLLVDIPILAILIKLSQKRWEVFQKRTTLTRRLISFFAVLLIGILLINVSYGKIGSGVFAYTNNFAVNKIGLPYFHFFDVKRFIRENYLTDRTLSKEEEEEILTYFEERKEEEQRLHPEANAFQGVAKGMNLLIVQVEAFQEFVVNKSYNNQVITPNFNALMKESVYFNNFYYQTGGGNTSDAEFLCNNSLFPMTEGSVYFRFPTNKYNSLPKLLAKENYNSYVFHANEPSFWNRTEMYKAQGFDQFFNKYDFVMDDVIGWGLTDGSLFRQGLEKTPMDTPFYDLMITLSSHHPFNFFDELKDFDSGEYEGTILGDYLKAMHYVDQQLKILLDELKAKGLYENTLLVIYGDHFAMRQNQAEGMDTFVGYDGSDLEWLKLQKVPFLIHYPPLGQDITQETIGGQVDILPTVANLMDISLSYTIGKDLFNTKKGYAVLRDGKIISEDFYYFGDTSGYYDASGTRLDASLYEEEMKRLNQSINISDLIVKKNALKDLP